MSTLSKLFSAVFFDEITFIGLGILLIPIAYKLWRRVKKQETSISIIRLSLIGLIFIFVWILVEIASSMWISFLASPFGGTRQLLIAQIWQSLWILSGLILSISNRAALGAILGAIGGLLAAIAAGCVVGFGIGFIIGLIPDGYSNGLGEQFVDAFMVGLFGAAVASFCAALFFSTFTTFGGAIFGFFADAFGKTHPYEKLLQRFRIKSDYAP